MHKKARLIAYYLPQFHPIPENDEWWGKGFTEWTNTAKAKPMFRGHYQPHVPADLGFYDLRLPEARIAQANLAREYGIEGFCYWHYWFGNGKRLLERPFNEVLKSGEPNFPFCLGWANQTWTGIWHGCANRILAKQEYPGESDYEKHFYAVLDAFCDDRYIMIEGKPVFVLYDLKSLPEPKYFADCWRKLAARVGLKGIYLVAYAYPAWDPRQHGFDAVIIESFSEVLKKLRQPNENSFNRFIEKITGIDVPYSCRRIFNKPEIFLYENAIKFADIPLSVDFIQYPCIFPNWDNTPRSGYRGVVLHQSSPELFRMHLRKAITKVCPRDYDQRVIFIKSWNEWAEGNYLEPDMKYGKEYLNVVKEEVFVKDGAVSVC